MEKFDPISKDNPDKFDKFFINYPEDKREDLRAIFKSDNYETHITIFDATETSNSIQKTLLESLLKGIFLFNKSIIFYLNVHLIHLNASCVFYLFKRASSFA